MKGLVKHIGTFKKEKLNEETGENTLEPNEEENEPLIQDESIMTYQNIVEKKRYVNIAKIVTEIMHSFQGLYNIWIHELYEYEKDFNQVFHRVIDLVGIEGSSVKIDENGPISISNLQHFIQIGFDVKTADLNYDIIRRSPDALNRELRLIRDKFLVPINITQEERTKIVEITNAIINGYVTTYTWILTPITEEIHEAFKILNYAKEEDSKNE